MSVKTHVPKQEEAEVEKSVQMRSSDPSSPATNQTWINKSSDELKYYDGASTNVIAAPGGAVSSGEVRVWGGNGWGNNTNLVRKFANVGVNTGTAITYTAGTAGNGDKFTINTTGIYAISYSEDSSIDLQTVNSHDYVGMGIGINSESGPNQYTGLVREMPAANALAASSIKKKMVFSAGFINGHNCHWMGPLSSGDEVFAHIDGDVGSDAWASIQFSIIKVG